MIKFISFIKTFIFSFSHSHILVFHITYYLSLLSICVYKRKEQFVILCLNLVVDITIKYCDKVRELLGKGQIRTPNLNLFRRLVWLPSFYVHTLAIGYC